MYNTTIDPIELTISSIVFTLYIVGKVWMYYRIEDNPNKIKKSKGVIRRGNEWPE